MRRYLLVANQTLGGPALAAKVKECVAAGECSFHIVVPATAPKQQLVWTEAQAHELAQERLDRELAWFASNGIEATGEVGDERPMLAIIDAMIGREFDEIILSTLPAGMSRWVRQDLPARARRRFMVPVSHVIGEPLPVKRTA